MTRKQHQPWLDRVGLRYPIVQGPFGGGLSTTQLAAAVSNRGGLGSYGAHLLEPEPIAVVIAELRQLTAAPFAINLWVSDHDPGAEEVTREQFDHAFRPFAPYFAELGVPKPEPPTRYHPSFDRQIEALLELRPPVFSFVFGIPSKPILVECARRGIVTIGTATSVAEAIALEEQGVDMIVASGFEAGGHRPSFLARAEDSLMGTFVLTQLVSSRVKVPVIAAGGIVDGRGVRAAVMLGAQAAQIGTAFLACVESGATDEHRALLHGATAERTVLTRAFSGRLARGLENRWTRDFASRTDQLAPFPLQSWFSSQLRGAALRAGRTDLVALWGGQAAPLLTHRTATELIDSLVTSFESDPT